MLTCFPKLLYNFVHRDLSDVLAEPGDAAGALSDAARWFAARDLTIAATFCRRVSPSQPP